MIIGIDGNEANLSQRVGVGQYAFNILTELSHLPSSHQYHIYLKSPVLPDMPPSSSNWHYHVFGPQKLWTRLALPLHLFFQSTKIDFFYSPAHYTPFPSFIPTIPTIHDLGYLSTPEQFTKKDFYQLTHWTEQSLKKAYHVMAVSEFTKSEITRIYGINPQKISVIYNGVTVPKAISTTKLPSSPYFLYVGTLKPNKNLPYLISAFAQYHQIDPTSKLVIAGKKGWLFQEIFATVQKEGIESSVIFTDYITENQKWNLYQHAIATIIPSLYEGFGIPAIESQQVGTPVIASHLPVFQEILQNSALFIDPHHPETLVKAFIDVQQKTIRSSLINRGKTNASKFTWTRSAQSLLHFFSGLVP